MVTILSSIAATQILANLLAGIRQVYWSLSVDLPALRPCHGLPSLLSMIELLHDLCTKSLPYVLVGTRSCRISMLQESETSLCCKSLQVGTRGHRGHPHVVALLGRLAASRSNWRRGMETRAGIGTAL